MVRETALALDDPGSSLSAGRQAEVFAQERCNSLTGKCVCVGGQVNQKDLRQKGKKISRNLAAPPKCINQKDSEE